MNVKSFFLNFIKKSGSTKKTIRYGDYTEIGSNRICSIITIIFIITMWIIVGKIKLVPELFWPPLPIVIKKFYSLLTEGYSGVTLLQHLKISIFRVLAGFFTGCVAGITVGISMGLSSYFRGFMDPIIELYRPVPPLAFIPLVIIWMGIGNTGKVFVLFLACFSIMVINSRSGVKSVEIEKVQAAYSMGASHWRVLTRVILINALPEIFTGMRVAMGAIWGTLVAAEMIASINGIGWTTMNASRFLMTDVVLIGIMVMGVCGYMFDLVLRTIEKKAIPWKGKS